MFTVGRSLSDGEFEDLANELAARVDSGDYNAARELADFALRELREVDVSDRLGGLFARAESGDRRAMELAARLRREGRIVPHDIPYAVDVYKRLAETEPRLNKRLVDALLCSDDPADWKRAFDICSNDGGDWTWDHLARMHHEGVGTPRDIYEAARIIEEHDLFPDRVRCALRIRPELHGRRSLVLAGTPEEVDVLLLRCMEDNVKPDFWWCPDGGVPRCASLLDEVISRTDDPSAVSGAVVLCESPVEAPGLPVYSVSGGEPLLVPDKGLVLETTCFVYTDGYLDSESERFLRSAVVINVTDGTALFEHFIESDDSEMNIVVAADVATIKSVLSKVPEDRVCLCTGSYSKNLECLIRSSKTRQIPLVTICFEYIFGEYLYEIVNKDAGKKVFVGFRPMGDQFRQLSKRESYYSDEPAIIVLPNAQALPELTGLRGYFLTHFQYTAIRTYAFMAPDCESTITFVELHPVFPGKVTRDSPASVTMNRGIARRHTYLFSSELETDASSMHYARFPVVERLSEIPLKSVLINPYGNYIKKYPEFTESYRSLFEALSRSLVASGYTVYTNAPSDEQAMLPDSRRMNLSMGELIPIIESFDFVISTFTGFIEAVMPTGVNLITIVPPQETRGFTALQCRRSNYWEYSISNDTKSLVEDICNLVTSVHPASSPLSEYRPDSSKLKTLDFSEGMILAADAVIWDTESVELAYRNVCNDSVFADYCISHSKSPFADYCEGRKLMDRGCWSEAAESLMRSYSMGCRAARDHLYRALWASNTQEAHALLLGLTIDSMDPLAIGYRGLLLARGAGIELNPTEAAGLLRSAMKGGVRFAANELLDVLWRIGTPEAYAEAAAVVRPLAEAGDGDAMGRLGRAYRDGRGVEQDLNKAAEWMRKAARKKDRWSNDLFDLLWRIGTPEAYAEAVTVVGPLADRGDRNALKRLSKAYAEGLGVPKDPDKAKELSDLASPSDTKK